MPTSYFMRILRMAKKYFIRKSHAELVQEQNQLLETLLAKQEEKVQSPSPQIIYTEKPATPSHKDEVEEFIEEEDIFEIEEDLPYIPPTKSKSSAKLFVDTNQMDFDDEDVKKLKKAKKKD